MRKAGRDTLAGLAVAGLILPEAVAYAGIAGLEPASALVAAIAGGLVYALIGRSRFAVVAPTSSAAAILAAALGSLGAAPAERATLAAMLVAMVGSGFVLAALFRLGGLSAFISRPVLRGFAFGLAVTIVVRQLPKLLGLRAIAPGNMFEQLLQILRALPQVHLPSLVLGLGTLAVLFALKGRPRWPATLIALVGGIAGSLALGFDAMGIAQAGAMPLHVPAWTLPRLSGPQWGNAAQLAAPIALILFAESWGSIRSLALRHGDKADATRELLALGGANLASAFLWGMPVGAGFSASAANEAAGAQSRWAGAIAAVAVLVLALLAGGLIARIPEPVLAAIVIAALAHGLSIAPFLRLERIGRDRTVALVAAGGVLALGVLNGMLTAVVLSLANLLRGYAYPTVSTLGRVGDDGHNFVDVAQHSRAQQVPGVGVYRPNAPLFFANAEASLAEAARRAEQGQVAVVILSLEQSSDLDSTAAEALREFVRSQVRAGRPVVFARLHDAARQVLAASGLSADAREGTFSVADAMDRAQQLLGAQAASLNGSISPER